MKSIAPPITFRAVCWIATAFSANIVAADVSAGASDAPIRTPTI